MILRRPPLSLRDQSADWSWQSVLQRWVLRVPTPLLLRQNADTVTGSEWQIRYVSPFPPEAILQKSRSCADGTFGVWGNPNKHRKARFPIFRKTGFSYLYIQMPSLPVTGSSIWISRCPACRDSGQKRFAHLYIRMHCLPGLSSCNPPPTSPSLQTKTICPRFKRYRLWCQFRYCFFDFFPV